MARIKIDKRDTRKRLLNAITGWALQFSNKMADAAPADQGALRASIRAGWTVSEKPGKIIVTFHMVPYAGAIEFGTKPRVIKAKNSKWLKFELKGGFKASGKWKGKVFGIKDSRDPSLVWFINKQTRKAEFGVWKIGGKTFMLIKQVNHPVSRPQPFIRPTLHKHAMKILKKNLRRAFRKR